MEKNQIVIGYGTAYKQMTREILEYCNLESLIPAKNSRIGIKPNLVAPVTADTGATTHPEIIEGILSYLKEHGFSEIVIMEGSWVGDRTEEAYEVCGYRNLCEKYNISFLDMQKEKSVVIQTEELELRVCKAVTEIDFLINVPVLKGHCQTKLSCALKNMKGILPNTEKRHFHAMGLHKPIAYLSKVVHQDFILVDSICGDLDFEDGGNPVVMNRILAGRDPVLIDAYACSFLQYEIDEIPYIRLAEECGVGDSDLTHADIRILGKPSATAVNRRRKVVEVSDQVQEVESCSACYAYLIPALDLLKEEGLLSKLDTKICIGQGYRGKEGILGVGNCTSHFRHHLGGCPPLEHEVYTFLKNYLKEG